MSRSSSNHSLLFGYALWIFGFTGAHRFYYGRRLSGTIWFFTLGLFGIGWFVDLFLMPWLARSAQDRYYDGPYDYSVAWLLQVYLGPFGLHRLYMGKWMSALLWFCTGGLFLLGYYYDYLTLNEQVSERNRSRLPAETRL